MFSYLGQPTVGNISDRSCVHKASACEDDQNVRAVHVYRSYCRGHLIKRHHKPINKLNVKDLNTSTCVVVSTKTMQVEGRITHKVHRIE